MAVLLSAPVIAAIVSASIVVLGAIGFCVYWFVFRSTPKPLPTEELVKTKTVVAGLGSLTVTPNSKQGHPTTSPVLVPDEIVTLTYEGTTWGSDVEKTYSYSIDNSVPKSVDVTHNSHTTFTVPTDVYSTNVRFWVSADGKNIKSQQAWEVIPSWTGTGPKGNLVVGYGTQFLLTANYSIAKAAEPVFEQSEDQKTWSPVVSASYNAETRVFRYTPEATVPKIHFRIRSTKFKEVMTYEFPTAYQVVASHSTATSVGGTITAVTASDIDGSALPTKVNPGERIRLTWLTSDNLNLNDITVEWSASPTTGFTSLYGTNVSAVTGTTIINLPDRATLGTVESIYIRITDVDDSSKTATTSQIFFEVPTWRYPEDKKDIQTSFGDKVFWVPVELTEPPTADDDFFNSAKWNYRISAPQETGCPNVLANTGETGATNYFVGKTAPGFISINPSSKSDTLYFVTFFVRGASKLPYFDSTGCHLSHVKLNVSVGFTPWDGANKVTTNPNNLELTTATPATGGTVTAAQEFGSSAELQYHEGKGIWHPFTEQGTGGKLTFYADESPTLTFRYINATNITGFVTWEFHYDGNIINLATHVPISPNSSSTSIVLPNYVRSSNCFVKVYLHDHPAIALQSDVFALGVRYSLGQPYNSTYGATTHDIKRRRPIDLIAYGSSSYPLRNQLRTIRLEYTTSPFTSHQDDLSLTWLPYSVGASFSDPGGVLTCHTNMINAVLGETIRLRFVAGDIISQATIRSYRVTGVVVNEDLQFDANDYTLRASVSPPSFFVYPPGQAVQGEPILIRLQGLAQTGGEWSHTVWYLKYSGADNAYTDATEAIQIDNSKLHFVNGGVYIFTDAFPQQLGLHYRIMLKEADTPSNVKFTRAFEFVNAWGISGNYVDPKPWWSCGLSLYDNHGGSPGLSNVETLKLSYTIGSATGILNSTGPVASYGSDPRGPSVIRISVKSKDPIDNANMSLVPALQRASVRDSCAGGDSPFHNLNPLTNGSENPSQSITATVTIKNRYSAPPGNQTTVTLQKKRVYYGTIDNNRTLQSSGVATATTDPSYGNLSGNWIHPTYDVTYNAFRNISKQDINGTNRTNSMPSAKFNFSTYTHRFNEVEVKGSVQRKLGPIVRSGGVPWTVGLGKVIDCINGVDDRPTVYMTNMDIGPTYVVSQGKEQHSFKFVRSDTWRNTIQVFNTAQDRSRNAVNKKIYSSNENGANAEAAYWGITTPDFLCVDGFNWNVAYGQAHIVSTGYDVDKYGPVIAGRFLNPGLDENGRRHLGFFRCNTDGWTNTTRNIGQYWGF